MILRRDTSAACSARGGSITSCSMPSTRKRTTERFSYGSKWRSDARSRSACSSSALIIRITGACVPLSRRSSAGGRSCISRARSVSRARSSEIPAAPDAAVLYVRASSAAKRSGSTARIVSGRCSTRFSSAMPSTVASGRVSTTITSPSSAKASTPCILANEYGMRAKSADEDWRATAGSAVI